MPRVRFRILNRNTRSGSQQLASCSRYVVSIVRAPRHQGEGMATFLLIVHGLLAVTLLGGITHQALSAAWPSRSKAGVLNSFRAVNGSVYTTANIVLYLATGILGGVIYPVYRVAVRSYLENAR